MKKQLTMNMLDALESVGIIVDFDKFGKAYYVKKANQILKGELKAENRRNNRLIRSGGRTADSMASRAVSKIASYGAELKGTYIGDTEEVTVAADVLERMKG